MGKVLVDLFNKTIVMLQSIPPISLQWKCTADDLRWTKKLEGNALVGVADLLFLLTLTVQMHLPADDSEIGMHY